MKLIKENVYVNLQGKSKEELTELWEFLDSIGEKQFRDSLNDFLNNYYGWTAYEFSCNYWQFSSSKLLIEKTEVTIEQLKDLLQPMGTFTPIAMKCTQEQFEAIKPKLNKKKSLNIFMFNKEWNNFYLALFKDGSITNGLTYSNSNREIREEWNEEIFLKACGIESESLEQQLQKAEAEVKRLRSLIEEENKPKVGDWAMLWEYDEETPVFGLITDVTDFYLTCNGSWENGRKITNKQLIELLENESRIIKG